MHYTGLQDQCPLPMANPCSPMSKWCKSKKASEGPKVNQAIYDLSQKKTFTFGRAGDDDTFRFI